MGRTDLMSFSYPSFEIQSHQTHFHDNVNLLVLRVPDLLEQLDDVTMFQAFENITAKSACLSSAPQRRKQ